MNLVVQVWLYQYLIKRITPEEYSLYPVVTALLIFIPPLLTVLTAGLARDTVEADALNDDRRITQITSTLFPLLAGIGLSLAATGLVIAKYLGVILKIAPQYLSEGRLMVLLLFGSMSLRMFASPFGVGLYVRQKFVLLNGLTMLQTLIRVGLLFVLLFGIGPRVLWVVVASEAADIIILLITTILSFQALPAMRFHWRAIRWRLLPGLMRFGLWNMIGSIGIMIRKSSDLLILNRFASPIDVNTFQLASLPDNQLDSVLNKMKEPLTPHMVALQATGGPAALQSLTIRGGRYVTWAGCLLAVPLIVFREQVWSIYLGSKLALYADVPLVMLLLLARYWIEGAICMIGQAAYAINRMRALSIFVIGQSVGNVAITLYFVRDLRMGAVGSALGTLVATVVGIPILWVFGLHLVHADFVPWFKDGVWRAFVPSVFAGVAALVWRYWLPPTDIPQLSLAFIFVAAVYVLSILLFCLDEDEHRVLKQLRIGLWWEKGLKAVVSPQ